MWIMLWGTLGIAFVCVAYYVGTRLLLMLDAIFIENEDPFSKVTYRQSDGSRWCTNDVPMRHFAWPILGEFYLLTAMIKWVSLVFGLVGKRLWTFQVKRTRAQAEARERREHLERRIEGVRREAERKALAALEADLVKEAVTEVQATHRVQ